jgi:hypothetical protein
MKFYLIHCALALSLAMSSVAFANTATLATPSRTDIKRLVVEEAEATGIPPSLALAVAKVESNFQAEALSHKGARGVMQIMPKTAQGEFGVAADELWDAQLNVQLGLNFLEKLIDRYGGRWDLALSHYNGGTLVGTGVKARPHGYTRRYVKSVLRWQRRYADQAKVWRLAKAATPKDAWMPAQTTIAELKTKRTSRKHQVRRRPHWRLVDTQDGIALDDFASGRVARILGQSRALDDFTPVVRWW